MAKQYEKYSILIGTTVMQIITTLWLPLTPFRVVTINKTNGSRCWGTHVESVILIHC